MSEWWLGTIIAIWCAALAGSELVEACFPLAFALMTAWCAIFATQLLSRQIWEGGASFAGLILATLVTSQLRRLRQGDG